MYPLKVADPVTFVAFDTETTGSFPVSERIVEIGAVKFTRDGTVLGEFCELVDPEMPIPRNVIRVHGIRNRDVRGKDPIDEVLPRFIDFIGDSILIAHNALFDVQFMGVQMIWQQLPFPKNPVLDSVEMCQEFLPDVKRHNLRNMSRKLGMNVRCHRALADSQVVRELFLSMVRDSTGEINVAELLDRFAPIYFSHARRVFNVKIPKHLVRLESDVEKGRALEIEYRSRGNGPEVFRVNPEGLFQHNRNAYLIAFCHESQRNRNFRLDRIKQIHTA